MFIIFPYILNLIYQKIGFEYGDFPISETYYNNAISLPLFSQLSFEEQDKVVNTLSKALK